MFAIEHASDLLTTDLCWEVSCDSIGFAFVRMRVCTCVHLYLLAPMRPRCRAAVNAIERFIRAKKQGRCCGGCGRGGNDWRVCNN